MSLRIQANLGGAFYNSRLTFITDRWKRAATWLHTPLSSSHPHCIHIHWISTFPSYIMQRAQFGLPTWLTSFSPSPKFVCFMAFYWHQMKWNWKTLNIVWPDFTLKLTIKSSSWPRKQTLVTHLSNLKVPPTIWSKTNLCFRMRDCYRKPRAAERRTHKLLSRPTYL